jgi:membrane protein insertase Oxa1/YidC/SpoIIIJ
MYLSMSHRWKLMPAEHQQMARYGAMIAPPVLTAAFWSFPSALCYYWTCSNIYTIVLELVLRHPGRAHPFS